MEPTSKNNFFDELIDFLFCRPLPAIAFAYVTGIAAAYLYAGRAVFLLLLCLLPVALIFLLLLFKKINWFRALVFTAVFIAGWAAFIFALKAPKSSIAAYTKEPVYIKGQVCEEPLIFEGYTEYLLKAEQLETKTECLKVTGKLLVRVYGRAEELYGYGERLLIRARVVEAKKMRNPGGVDYNFYLKSRGIDALAYPSASMVESLGPGDYKTFTGDLLRLRMALTSNIDQSLPVPQNHLLNAILFGQKHRLPALVEDNFRKAGAGHLMAVSGLHVGLLAAFITSVLRFFGLKGRLPLILALALVLAYACLTGLKPSAVRAALMSAAALGALLFDREADLPSAIAFALLVTLACNPLALFTVGFQLSYVATLAIVYAYKPLKELFIFCHVPRFLQDLLAVTTAAQLGVIPLTSFYFYTLSTGALFYNLLLIPLMGFIFGFGFSGAVLSLLFPRFGMLLINAVSPLLELMLKITSFGEHPVLYMPVHPPSFALMFIYYALAVLLLFFYHNRPGGHFTSLLPCFSKFKFAKKSGMFRQACSLTAGRLFIVVLTLAVVFSIGSIFKSSGGALQVTFIDVGQGAAVLIKAPCGASVLIDAGGRPEHYGNPAEIGEKIVMPFLLYSGVKNIDLGVITHPHEDHYDGFIPLVDQLTLDRLLVSAAPGESESYAGLLEAARHKKIAVTEAAPGQLWAFDCGLLLEVLGPPQRLYQSTTSDLNNNSIVMMLHYGDYKMLFTGDIEEQATADLLTKGYQLKADLLQVPHHGGLLSLMPELLKAVKPDWAVIQVGANSFGHPHPQTLQALADAGVKTFRNDQHGAVIITVDRDGLKADSFAPAAAAGL